MSTDSTNKPDEYENIFDESYVEGNSLESNTTDANEPIDIDAIYRQENAENFDEDIEDGIFAPERKAVKNSKKSSSLLVSVSLLAVMGVLGFVYFSNPDILSKVNSNLADKDEVILPQETSPEVAIDSAPVPDRSKEIVEALEQDDVVIPTVENEGAVEPNMGSGEVVTPQDVASPVSTPLPSDTPKEFVVSEIDANQSSAVVQPVIPENSDNISSEVPDAVSPSVLEVVSPVVDTIPHQPDENVLAETAVKKVDLVETNKKEENIAVAPVIAESAPQPTEKVVEKTKLENQAENIVVVNSKEEQKILDDAKLDKYFDSPNGKMLKDIPAPSMNPMKGRGESIIIVNKRGQSLTPKSKSLSIETTNLDRQTTSANRALKLGRFDAAKEMYDDLYRINPKDEGILSGRALVLQKMGQHEQAISAYEQLLKLYPDNVDAVVNLSGLIRKQYPAVALNKLLDLHMEHPNNVIVIAQLGVTYADVGNFPDAIRYLSLASEMDSKNPLHFYNLAVILEKAGKPAEAIKNYEKALEIDSIFSDGKKLISREKVYDRLSQLRGN